MKIFDRIIFITVFIFIGLVLFNVFTKNKIDLKETTVLNGKFISIKRDRKNKSVYYDSYTLLINNTTSKTIKIIPEYYSCFDYNEFIKNSKPNDEIELRIDNNEKRLFNNILSVVSIRLNSKEYINTECVNKSIEKEKIQLPLIIIGLIIFISLIIFIQKRLGIKIN